MGKARGMALREAIFAEALDLVEAALGKAALITALDHAGDHLLLEPPDGAAPLEGRHRLAQLVELARREIRRHHGKLHRLLLEQRHPLGLAEHRIELVAVAEGRVGRGIVLRLQPLSAPEIGMDHVALDRAGADDRHLDHQVVKRLGPEPWQHVHLRPAFDLEDADQIGPAQHLIDLGSSRGTVASV